MNLKYSTLSGRLYMTEMLWRRIHRSSQWVATGDYDPGSAVGVFIVAAVSYVRDLLAAPEDTP